MDAIQRELRDIPGVTILIYAQACATEKRRQRKRGTLEDPNRFAVINDLVCEGCGDCSVESNCLSVVPKETPFGRKRQIDQNTCNKDFSCLNGFCPSFVTVEGGTPSAPDKDATLPFPDDRLAALPVPELPRLDASYDLLVTGVGGTGVITVGALITMAAHLEGKGASVLDFMGFAQKFGPVLSYIRIAADPALLNQVRIDEQQADALIGCDLVVSSSPQASKTYRHGSTRAVLNTTEMSTADFVRHRDANLKAGQRINEIRNAVGRDNLTAIAANRIAEKLLGNTIYANVLMFGAAWQLGLVPVSLKAAMRAIELNGVEVERNQQAFSYGRIAAHDPEFVTMIMDAPEQDTVGGDTLDQAIERRRAFLVDYQDEKLADRYIALVERVRNAEQAVGHGTELTDAVAHAWFRLLAYKDEYEVARLHTDSGFIEKIRKDYGPDAKIRFHLAPPIMNRKRDARGRPLKREFGAWMIPVFKVLARLRGLRGTRFDLFGLTAERRMERALIREFETTVETLLEGLNRSNVAEAARIASLYLEIRGYGPVKDEAVATVRKDVEDGLVGYATLSAEAA